MLLTADEVINQMTEILREWDGEDLENIAHLVIGSKINYVEDSMFEMQDEDDLEDELEEQRRDEKRGTYPDKWNDCN